MASRAGVSEPTAPAPGANLSDYLRGFVLRAAESEFIAPIGASSDVRFGEPPPFRLREHPEVISLKRAFPPRGNLFLVW